MPKRWIRIAGIAIPVLVLSGGCTCGDLGVQQRSYACTSNTDCAAGYVCDPASLTCTLSSVGTGLDAGTIAQDSGAPADASSDAGRTATDAGLSEDSGGGVDSGTIPPDASIAPGPDSGVDSGFVESPDSGCEVYTSVVDPAVNGTGSALEWNGAPRFLYNDPGTSQTVYTECVSGCAGPTPSYSTPIDLSEGESTPPEFAAVDSSLITGFWRSGGSLVYAECGSTCSTAASWSQIAIADPGGLGWGGSNVGLAVAGSLRAGVSVTAGNPDAGVPFLAAYAECTSGCGASAGNWASVAIGQVNLGGRSIALSTVDGGLVLRTAAFAPSGPLLYAECTSNCTVATSWNQLQLDNADDTRVVIDLAGLPRVFFQAGNGNGGEALNVTRCQQRPCTVSSNWASTQLLATVVSQSVGNAPDGSTWFVADDGTVNWVGVESGAVYNVFQVGPCGTAVHGTSPAGYLGSQQQLRLFYDVSPNGMTFLYQAP